MPPPPTPKPAIQMALPIRQIPLSPVKKLEEPSSTSGYPITIFRDVNGEALVWAHLKRLGNISLYKVSEPKASHAVIEEAEKSMGVGSAKFVIRREK